MVTTDVKTMFIDTNILIYAFDRVSTWKLPAITALQNARNDNFELVISPQILREFLAVVTKPAPRGSGAPMTVALNSFRLFQSQFRVLDDNRAILQELDNLLQNFAVGGKQIHDTNIVAKMRVHGVTHLLTNNVADFNRFGLLITIVLL